MKNKRKILHIDMDAFFASIEQAHNPRLRGKPVVVGGRPDKKRTVVCAASYEAKKLGIDSGMSTQEAFRICPYAEFVSADSSKYIYVSNQISKILQNYSPQVEQASVDEFYLDVTNMENIYGSLFELGMQIKNDIRRSFNITGSVGISINRLMSKIASKLKKPDGMFIMDLADIPEALGPLEIKKIPGIGPSLTAKLNDLSIFTFSDLAKHPADFYQQRFGKVGLWIYSVVHPECFEESDIDWIHREKKPPKSIGHSYTLANDIYSRSEIEAWLQLLCEMVGFRLRRHNLEASTVSMYLRRSDMKFVGSEKNFKEYTSDSGHLFKRGLYLLNRFRSDPFAVRALGVSVKNLVPQSNGFLLSDVQKRADICKAQDKINSRYGDWTVYPASICSIV